MKDTKTVLKLFSYLDRKGIEEFMTAQARDGWMLDKIGLFGFRFKRCEPKNLHFSLVYYPAASFFDPAPTEKEMTFRDFCEYSGWKVAASSGSMLIFYTEENDAVPIETDIGIELKSVFKAMLPLVIVNLAYLVIALFYQMILILGLVLSPIVFFGNNAMLVSQICLIPGMGVVLADLIIFLIWYLKARKAVKLGENDLPNVKCPMLAPLSYTLILASLGLDLFSISGKIGAAFPYPIGILLVIVSSYLIAVFLKALKASKHLNIIITTGFCVLVSAVFCVSLIYGLEEHISNRHQKEPIEVNGVTKYKYTDPIPLKLQDLCAIDGDRYNQYLNQDRNSLLLHYVDASQSFRMDQKGKIPQPRNLMYNAVHVRAPFLYSACQREMEGHMLDNYGMPEEDDPNFDKRVPIDAAPWGAKEAYQLYIYDEPTDTYLLCYEKHIVRITYWTDEEHPLTPDMQKIIGEKLTAL